MVFKGLQRIGPRPHERVDSFGWNHQKITFQSIVETFATLQAAAGTDIRTIQSMMAHKSITTTQRYMKVVDSNKRGSQQENHPDAEKLTGILTTCFSGYSLILSEKIRTISVIFVKIGRL